MNNGKSRPMLMGDRVRLLGETDGAFKDYAIVGTHASRGLAIVVLAPHDQLLAPLYAYPASSLLWNVDAECWQGPLPPDRSAVVLLQP